MINSYFENKDQLFDVSGILNAVRGRFSPNQICAYLNMNEDELLKPENYVVLFHERFHYLETIFSPYGHLKWSSFRSITADIIDMWLSLTLDDSTQKKIPIAEYLNNPKENDIRILANIWMQDWTYQIFSLFERGQCFEKFQEIFNVKKEDLGPIITLGDNYQIRGIDILESFAKFQEGILSQLIGYRDFAETLDTSKLNREYYSALHYFISKVGGDRISEFPIACELSLTISHLPTPKDYDSILSFSIGHRFSVIVEYISNHPELKDPDIHSNKAFFDYANTVLIGCGFDDYESHWEFAKKYMNQADLELAREMERAIIYKMENPWILSFPFRTPEDFASPEFNRFYPLFTITNDSVLYNLNSISPTELVLENHFQALSLQICGRISNRCIYPNMLQCGFSYFGTNSCPHQLLGECNGHIDMNSILPKLECDSYGNLKSGCSLELVLCSYGTSIK